MTEPHGSKRPAPAAPYDDRAWLAERLPSELWDRLGFAGDDLTDVRHWAAAVLTDRTDAGAAARRHVVDRARALPRLITEFPSPASLASMFGSKEDESYPIPGSGHGYGTLAILALAAGVQGIRDFHRSRGVPDSTSWETLADLGQQVRVHRETFGEFGFHTFLFVSKAWSGSLYGLGRLQFHLWWYEPKADAAEAGDTSRARWVLETHIPGTGPLSPDAVDDSFARATAFFPGHFPEFPTHEFRCRSWLLDPRMSLLDPASNTARFQARWVLEDEGRADNAAAIFFLWRRRDDVSPASLPTDGSMRRLVVDEIVAGRPWRVPSGLIAQARRPAPVGG